jgi:membrane-associated protease RseP (regulator of RpoE activity)
VPQTIITTPVIIQQPIGGSDIDVPPPEWGLKVTQLAPEGPAAKAMLQVGHVIVMAGDQRTQSFEQLTGVLNKANGPIEVVIYLENTRQLVKTVIAPQGGKIGVAVEPVLIK